MAHADYCGIWECAECPVGDRCKINSNIPCSPDCDGLDGVFIDVGYCIENGCLDNLCYMFYGEYDESGEQDNHYIDKLFRDYVNLETGMAVYPYV